MKDNQRDDYLMALALACAAWANPPQWKNQDEREQAERAWFVFLSECVPAQEILNGSGSQG